MYPYFASKCNTSICKIVFVNVLFCNLIVISGQHKPEKEAIHKKEKLEINEEKRKITEHETLLKFQFEKQGKLTQKRMKKNQKMIDKYYKIKTRKTLWQKIYRKQKPKKYRKLT